MNYKRYRWIALLLLLAGLVASGCASTDSYRPKSSSGGSSGCSSCGS